jgi:hypothetical protein
VGSTVTSGDWVELQRQGCLGFCPAYTVRLYGSGVVSWHGDSFVAVRGVAAGQVDAGAAANLIQQLRDHGFASLCGDYRRGVTDNATAPAWLRDFDDRIDALADTHRWRHGEPSRELFGDRRLLEDVQFPKPGRTQLMQAAGTPGGPIQLLLEQKVLVDAEDASGWTALMYAAAGDSPSVQVRQLLAAGAAASRSSRAGETLLFAAAGSRVDPVRKLVLLQKAGANAAAVSNDGTTLLMIAVSRYRQPEVLKTVLAMGVNPSVRNSQGKTALDLLDQSPDRTENRAAYEAARALLLRAH